MKPRDDAWLRHQQRRWMQPDAARWIRADVARFLKPGTNPADVFVALLRKYDGQPRLPEGEGGGQYTFGRRDGDTTDSSGRPRVYIYAPRQQPEDESEGEAEGGADSFGLGAFLQSLLAAALGPGIGHNTQIEPEGPPEIPASKPRSLDDLHRHFCALLPAGFDLSKHHNNWWSPLPSSVH